MAPAINIRGGEKSEPKCQGIPHFEFFQCKGWFFLPCHFLGRCLVSRPEPPTRGIFPDFAPHSGLKTAWTDAPSTAEHDGWASHVAVLGQCANCRNAHNIRGFTAVLSRPDSGVVGLERARSGAHIRRCAIIGGRVRVAVESRAGPTRANQQRAPKPPSPQTRGGETAGYYGHCHVRIAAGDRARGGPRSPAVGPRAGPPD
jgi:hypothetical protein